MSVMHIQCVRSNKLRSNITSTAETVYQANAGILHHLYSSSVSSAPMLNTETLNGFTKCQVV